MQLVASSVDDIDEALEIAASTRPLRGVATYEDVHKLSYLRDPFDRSRNTRGASNREPGRE